MFTTTVRMYLRKKYDKNENRDDSKLIETRYISPEEFEKAHHEQFLKKSADNNNKNNNKNNEKDESNKSNVNFIVYFNWKSYLNVYFFKKSFNYQDGFQSKD